MITSYATHDCTLIDVPSFIDERGIISVMDKELPFQVKRIFWLHHIQNEKERGAHALMEGTEIIVAIHGSFVVDLDDGIQKTSVLLNDATKGLMIRPGIWFKTRRYLDDGISLIVANEEFCRDRYIYNYSEFLKLRRK